MRPLITYSEWSSRHESVPASGLTNSSQLQPGSRTERISIVSPMVTNCALPFSPKETASSGVSRLWMCTAGMEFSKLLNVCRIAGARGADIDEDWGRKPGQANGEDRPNDCEEQANGPPECEWRDTAPRANH